VGVPCSSAARFLKCCKVYGPLGVNPSSLRQSGKPATLGASILPTFQCHELNVVDGKAVGEYHAIWLPLWDSDRTCMLNLHALQLLKLKTFSLLTQPLNSNRRGHGRSLRWENKGPTLNPKP
jgi:hypothetical protein